MTVADLVQKNKGDCCGCYACKNICPVNAVVFDYDDEGFWYPTVKSGICVNCGKCVVVCPCINKPTNHSVKCSFACNIKNHSELLKSSSGGAFAEMARSVLRRGGFVCGAAFDDDFNVQHMIIESEDDLTKLRGTKYVQSKIGAVLLEIKELLENNKKVLFSGTPCQVAGLNTFLEKEYDNLITVDLICHGVPSPGIWQEYLKQLTNGDTLLEVNFRNKENGISNATIEFVFESGKVQKCSYAEDSFIKGFLKNYYLRPSCFECKFKGFNRCSDITIGDFWAVKEYYPDFNSQFGTSAVIIRTNKGLDLFESVSDNLNVIPVNEEHFAVWNECLLKSVKHTKKREDFYNRYGNIEFVELINELASTEDTENTKKSFFAKVKNKLWSN